MSVQDNLPLIALIMRDLEQEAQAAGQDVGHLVDERLFSRLTPKELLAFKYDWQLWARPDQLPPPGDWSVWLIMGGRGSGKTRSGAEWVLEKEREGCRRIAIVAETEDEGRHTLVEGDAGILACAPPYNRPAYQPENRKLIWPSGAVARLYSGDSPKQFRGPAHDAAWLDEVAKWRYPEQTFANLDLGLRVGDLDDNPQCVMTTTPRPVAFLLELMQDSGCVTVQMDTYANAAHLPAKVIERIEKRYKGTRLGRQEIDGELLTDTPGALWTLAIIDKTRIRNPKKRPNYRRIVIGVDPQGKKAQSMGGLFEEEGEGSETGIVVCGKDYDGRGYVLDDRSGDYDPNQWAQEAVAAYNRENADLVVAEGNHGGEMVRETIRAIDPSVPVELVWASDGKKLRAEPISVFYRQGNVSHVGTFASLEDEMRHYTGKEKQSPNRLDALVWALTELFKKEDDSLPHFDPKVHVVMRPTRFRGESDEQYEARCQAKRGSSV